MGGKPWFRDEPELRRTVKEAANEQQPELHWVVEDQTAFLRGTFHVVHEGDLIDRYKVEIEFPHNYPDERPVVRETDDRIPLIAERHMNRDGTACLFLDDEYEWRHPDGMSFQDFLDQAMMSYFICQSYYERTGEWLLDDRAHSAAGVVEFYEEILGTEKVGVILEYLDYIERDAKGHWDCPCGSGERVRNCHQDLMWELKDRISEETAKRSKYKLIKGIHDTMTEKEKRAKKAIQKHV